MLFQRSVPTLHSPVVLSLYPLKRNSDPCMERREVSFILPAELNRRPLCLSIGPSSGWTVVGAIPQHLSTARNEHVNGVVLLINYNFPLMVVPIREGDLEGKFGIVFPVAKRVVSARSFDVQQFSSLLTIETVDTLKSHQCCRCNRCSVTIDLHCARRFPKFSYQLGAF